MVIDAFDERTVTGPVARFCRQIAGHGYIVAAPSSYHEFTGPEPLAYDGPGTDAGNDWKVKKVKSDIAIVALSVLPLLSGFPMSYVRGRAFTDCERRRRPWRLTTKTLRSPSLPFSSYLHVMVKLVRLECAWAATWLIGVRWTRESLPQSAILPQIYTVTALEKV